MSNFSQINKDNEKTINTKFESIKKGQFRTEDATTVLHNTEEILSKSSTGPLATLFDDITTMCCMVKAWVRKEYTGIPVKTIGMIILTLTYVFSPLDIIPDIFPVIGLLDDATMVTLCLAAARSDINDFRIWQEKKQRSLDNK